MTRLVLTLLLWPSCGMAATECVLLSDDTTMVIQDTHIPGPDCPGNYAIALTAINTADARWTTFVGNSYQTVAIAYEVTYGQFIANGIALTSTGNSALNATYPIDDATVNTLLGIYASLSNVSIATGSISGTVLTVSAMQPDTGQILNKKIVTGTGVATGTKITSFGTGTGDVGTYNLSGGAQTIGSEFILIGGKSSGFPGGLSAIQLADTSNTLHSFNPVEFLNYAQAVKNFRASLSAQVVQAVGWPVSNGVTIP